MTKFPAGRCLGLIGGLGVGATVHYYRELAKAHEARGSGMRLLMVHADMPLVLDHVRAGERVRLAQYLAELVGRVQAGGAQIAAVPAVAPHICAGELVRMSPLPLVNLLDAVNREIGSRGIRRVALFGTRFAMETRLFGQLGAVELVMPRPEEVEFVHETYVRVARDGAGTEADHGRLTALAHTLCERDGVEAIILTGTDLSLVFNEANTDFPHLDCARLHIESIMRDLFPDRADTGIAPA